MRASRPQYSYVLTEEIARQAVEVMFRTTPVWFVAFSNPTAGPWKVMRLQINGAAVEVATYLKEEDRPDLILQDSEERVMIILEAKKSVDGLLNSSQLTKSIGVFVSESARLKGILREHGMGDYRVAVGFVYPTPDPAADRRRLDDMVAPTLRAAGIDGYLSLFVVADEDRNLAVFWFHQELTDKGREIEAVLESRLPPQMAHHVE